MQLHIRLHKVVQVFLELDDLRVLRKLLERVLQALAAPSALGDDRLLNILHRLVQVLQNGLLELLVAELLVVLLEVLAHGLLELRQLFLTRNLASTGRVQPAEASITRHTIAGTGASYRQVQGGQERPQSRAPITTVFGPFKLGSPPTTTGLVPIELPQLAEPAIEAECIFAFVGECEWTKTEQDNDLKATEPEKERGDCLGGGVWCEEDDKKESGDTAEDWLASAGRLAPTTRSRSATLSRRTDGMVIGSEI
ncbi:hypothetical protein ON010_g4643 [Phytophthora cinnamomi]|nr:hypothetical protein ON010_g4643 [Phytophthora cinnamomi]